MATSPTLRFILGDQVTRTLSSLSDLDQESDVVLMVEVPAECTHVGHHKKKIAFILSAMRHFAKELEEEGVRVDYRTLDHPNNRGDFRGELKAAVEHHQANRVVVTEPGKWRVLHDMLEWEGNVEVTVEIRSDDRFLASRSRFEEWAESRRSLRMEYFYREMQGKRASS